jgi:ABC-type uncharacterized transport system substrate-binding protein
MRLPVRRREFIILLGGAVLAWPLVARAQQSAMPVIGFLNSQSPGGFTERLRGFHRGLKEAGYVEGENVAIEYRWAKGRVVRLPELAKELVRRQPALIVATGGSLLSVKATNTAIPVVATFGGDPVNLGFVKSLNRPGGNITGASVFTSDLEAKRLELLHELVPGIGVIGVLIDPRFSHAKAQLREVQAGARAIGRKIHVANISNDSDLDAALAEFAQTAVAALFERFGDIIAQPILGGLHHRYARI